jgi:cAMP-dependent protein kinase regulator
LSSGAISKVMEEDENDTITSPTTPSFGFSKGGGSAFGGSFGGDASGEGPPSSFKATSGEGFPAHYGMGRRTSVSAESFHPKSEDQIARLKKSISGNFLFSHLDDEQSSQVLGALVEKPIPAKDIKVCKRILCPCSWKCHSSPLPVKKRCLLATDNHVLGYHSRRSRGLLLRS